MPIVYLVYFSDCKYEGGSVEAAFSTEEKATEYALRRLDEEKQRTEHYNLHLGDNYVWKRMSPLLWSDDMQVLQILPFLIDDPKYT